MKRLISALIFTLFTFSISLAAYNDVPENHEYIQGITYIELQGASDHAINFRPDDKITQAEAAKLIFEVMGVKLTSEGKYWFTPYQRLADEYDLIPLNEFTASNDITRGEALKMIMKAYGISTPIIPFGDFQFYKDVRRKNAIFPWIYQMIQLDIHHPEKEYFHELTPITRGEFSEWLYRLDKWMQIFNLDLYEKKQPDFYKSDIMSAIWDRISNDFYTKENVQIDKDALFQAAVKGMLTSLNDPYSEYFTEDESNQFTESLSGEFEGIGAVLEINDDGKTEIVGLIEDAPASNAGVRKGDILTAVDSIKTQGMEMNEIIKRIKGPQGTHVTLTVLRGDRNLDIKIQRGNIEIIHISGWIKNNKAWWIDIDSFTPDLPAKLMKVIQSLEEEKENPKGVVIDLRGNPGGSLQSATFTTGLFVPTLTPLVQLDYGGFAEKTYNGDTGPYQDKKIFVLIDENSASASEIVASTLQENGATIIGHQSFGKGTTQNYTNYWDGSALKITVAEWLSGGGQSIEGVGVSPDVSLPADADENSWWGAVKRRL